MNEAGDYPDPTEFLIEQIAIYMASPERSTDLRVLALLQSSAGQMKHLLKLTKGEQS